MKITDYINEKVTYDETCIWVGTSMLLEIRGWSKILKKIRALDEAGKFQDQVGQFIADAINEKIERENN